MAGTIKFSYSDAKSTAKTITTKGGQVETLINDIQREIQKSSSWWTGKDYEAFNNYFTSIKPKLVEFAKKLNETGDSLNKVADIKQRQEDELAKAFK